MSSTPAIKRVIGPSQTPRLSEYGSSPKLMQLMEQKLMKQFENITNMIKESETRILQQLENKVMEIKTELHNVHERINNVENVVSEVNELKREVSQIKLKLLQQENATVSCDLRINGVPYCENENLNVIFNNLCASLNISAPRIQTIYRLKTKNNSPASPILVKCATSYERNFVLKTISDHRRKNKDFLRLTMIGFNSNELFYVNENLSQSNYKLFFEARKLKKQKRLYSVFTMRGIVYVKRSDTDPPLQIYCNDHLEQLFRNDAIDNAM